MQVNSEVMFFP